jgi:phosphoglycerol transferase
VATEPGMADLIGNLPLHCPLRPSKNRSAAVTEIGRFGLAVVLCMAVLTLVLHLWNANWRVPFDGGKGDPYLSRFLVKTLIEEGWYLRNSHLSAPFGLDMSEFPLVDAWHFASLKVIAFAFPNDVIALNIYFVLGFPLATLLALAVLRKLGADYWPALISAILFAFLPYHFLRNEGHIFLSSYYLVPLQIIVVIRLLQGDGKAGARHWRWALAICFLSALAGIYYAFFTCFFLTFTICYSCWEGRRRQALEAACGIVASAAAVLLNLVPTIYYRLHHGPNQDAVRRNLSMVEVFSLKPIALLLPVEGHRVGYLNRLASYYKETTFFNYENFAAPPLGIVGSVGFLYLLAILLRRGKEGAGREVFFTLSRLTAAALLLGTVGGFGSVFGILGGSWIRAYNRISIFIAFFALAAAALLLTAAAKRMAYWRRGRLIGGVCLSAILVLGVLDQTTAKNVPNFRQIGQRELICQNYVDQIEAAVPPNTAVFQLPYAGFLEATTVGKAALYEQLYLYLHSTNLRWNYGAMPGHLEDTWQKAVSGMPASDLLDALAYSGFGGLEIDRDGYDDQGAEIVGKVRHLLGMERCTSEDGRHLFFDLGPFAASLRHSLGEGVWQAHAHACLHPLEITWRAEFGECDSREGRLGRWGAAGAELVFVNSDSTGWTLQMTCQLSAPEASSARIAGDLVQCNVPLDRVPRAFNWVLRVPPGKHSLQWFPCEIPSRAKASPFIFRLDDAKLVEVSSDSNRPDAQLKDRHTLIFYPVP